MKIRNPELAQAIEIIENYKQENPDWWYNDFKVVFDMYEPLRKIFGFIAEELLDLELVLNSMVREIQKWAHEERERWVLKRCKI